MSPNSLVWSPVYKALDGRIKSGDDLVLIIVPFGKLAALQQLHSAHSNKGKLKVICRWRPEDLIAGVSDVEVFTYLKEAGSQLFINFDIHLKLYVFASNTAFNTSGNLTMRGLGYGDNPNIEVGNMVSLTFQDWSKIYEIINTSREVDETLYQRFKEFVEKHPKPPKPEPFPAFFPPPKKYTISSLPACASPVWLAAFYLNPDSKNFTPEEVRRAAHDFTIFGIPSGLTQSKFNQRLGGSFCRTPFVTDFVAFLKTERSLRFGAVNDWIHKKCDDVPLPYRYEIKENTSIFYDWLAHFIPEITWDRPTYSQVIYWNGETPAIPEVVAKDVDYYRKEFCELTNRDRARNYEQISIGGAPHQPVLLLTVIDLYAKDATRRNCIKIDDSLVAPWDRYKNLIGITPSASVAMPAYALRHTSFWRLVHKPSARKPGGRVRNLDQFNEQFAGVELDEDLHTILQNPAHRKSLREAIIKAYFPSEHWNSLNI